jgi:hypothetical protein
MFCHQELLPKKSESQKEDVKSSSRQDAETGTLEARAPQTCGSAAIRAGHEGDALLYFHSKHEFTRIDTNQIAASGAELSSSFVSIRG